MNLSSIILLAGKCKGYRMIAICCLLAFLLYNTQNAHATHAAGAELTYRCLGGLVYEIEATFYRDCGGTPEPGSLTINYKSVSCSYSRTEIANKISQNNGLEITMPCASAPSSCNGGASTGLKKWIYRTTVTLPFACTDWVFSYRVCCRNCTITTIQSPCSITSELYVEAMLNNIDAPCNNSPQFTGVPLTFVCLGQNINYNSAVSDIDGDSLSYELIKPKTGSDTEVNWIAPATTLQPLGSSTPFTINQQTGDINFTPNTLQVGIIAVRVREFRNGVFIGSVIQDVQVYTQSCFNSIPYATGVNGTSNFSINACAGQNICFNINTGDADSLQLVTATLSNLPQGAIVTQTSGPRPVLQFCWTPSVNDVSQYPKIFTVKVRDNACPQNSMQTYSYSVLVNGYSISATATGVTCKNSTDGTATVSGTGLPGGTVLWNTNPPQSTITATGLEPGTYTVLVTGQSGCTASAQATVDPSNNFVSVEANGSGLITCHSGNIGEGQAVVTGGTSPYSYMWSNGTTTNFTGNLAYGIHTVTVTDASGCFASDTLRIHQSPDNLDLEMVIVSNVNCYNENSGIVQVNVSGGTGPYTYLWNNGKTSAQLDSLFAGVYTVTVADIYNCTAVASVSVEQPQNALHVRTVSVNHISCYGGNEGSIQINTGGGSLPYTYLWSTGDINSHIFNLSAGNYYLTVTDKKGCTYNYSNTINQPADSVTTAVLSIKNADCTGGNNGEISLAASGGTGPYIYSWNNGMTGSAISGLTSGTYVVTVIDANHCTSGWSFDISEPAAPVQVLSGPVRHIVCGQGTGSISVSGNGGVAPYSYLWNNGASTPHINNLQAGIYTVTVTDHNGCTVQGASEVKANGSQIGIVSDIIKNVGCYNGSDGSIGVILSGTTGFVSVLWNTGSTTIGISNIIAGTYTITVTDSLGCSATDSFFVSQPPVPLIAEVTVLQQVSCGQANGQLSAQANGGTAPYIFNWSNGDSGTTIQNLTAGTYSLTVTDSNGCSSTYTTELRQQSSGINGTASLLNNVSCKGGADGSAVVNPGSSSGPLSYLWNNGTTLQMLTSVPAGVYSVIISDASGCTSTDSVTIEEPLLHLTANTSGTIASCIKATGAEINSFAEGGTSPYQYIWNNNSSTSSQTGVYSGIYTVTVTDANGCTAVSAVQVQDSSELHLHVMGSDTICAGESTSLFADSLHEGTYQWYFEGNILNGVTGYSFITPAAGNYYVTYTNSCGTFQSDSVKIAVRSMQGVSVSNSMIVCPPETATLIATGGTSYLWTPASYITFTNVADPVVSPLNSTVYSVEISDDHGCKTTLSTTVSVVCDSLMVPTGFSPNGDGVNDGYVIDGIEQYPGNKIWVYNRYGKLVYKATDYMNNWDGVSNISGLFMNRKVGSGTYYYILDLNDRSKPRAGYLIIRH